MEEQKFLYTIYYRLYIIFLNYVTLNKHIYYYYYRNSKFSIYNYLAHVNSILEYSYA